MALNGWLFTFPFWLIVDTIAPPAIVETEVSDRFVRVYPPFRSAPANSAYAPSLDLRNVPFPDGITVTANGNSMFVRIGVYPTLEPNSEGELGVCISLDEEFTTAPSRNFPMDSLRLDISEADDPRRNLADSLAVELLHLLRWKTDQWWIMRSIHPLLGYARNQMPVDHRGAPAPSDHLPTPHSNMHTSWGFERAITSETWREAIALWAAGITPPETALIVLDAYYFATTGEIRRAVIDAATACEQAKDEVFQRTWCARSRKPFKRGRLLTGYDLPYHLSRDMNRLLGRSYKLEHPNEFATIENLWDARGNIAHGGELTYKSNGTDVPVTAILATHFANAVRHCVGWLASL